MKKMSASEIKKVDGNIFKMSTHEIKKCRQLFAVSKYFFRMSNENILSTNEKIKCLPIEKKSTNENVF
jgi:hypothetical protein